jgi:rRNA maturation endonuclease Nob1
MVEGTTLEQHEDGRWFAVAVAEDNEGWGCDETFTRVKFCPWCGRKLAKKSEK